MSVLGRIMRISNHQIWSIELINLLISRCYISIIFHWTFSKRSRSIIFTSMLGPTMWCLNFSHIYLKIFFNFYSSLCTSNGLFGIKTDSGCLFLQILFSCLATSWNVTSGIRTLTLFTRDLKAHEAGDSILAQVYWCLIWVWLFLFWTIFVLKSVNIVTNCW